MNAAFALRMLRRESRGARARLAFTAACLAIGVAAVVAVAALADAVEGGVRAQARELLAADLVVRSHRPLPPELDRILTEPAGAERADVVELATMVAADVAGDPEAVDGGPAGRSRLAELKVVDGRYPLYGALALTPPRPLAELLGPERAVVAPELLGALRLAVGDALRVGGARFEIAGTVDEEPDRLGFSLTLGPRVFLSKEGLARTELLGFGNRVRHEALFRLPPGADATAWERRVERELPDAAYVRVETAHDAQPGLRRALRRLERFLGLVALLSLLLGGIGVAQVVRAWLDGRADAIATLRCLGLRPREVLALYLAQVALLALLGSALGALVGASAPALAAHLAGALFPGPPAGVPWAAVARGLALGVGIALVFALLPLTAVWRVPPARVLRADAAPLAAPRAVRAAALAALALGVLASARLQGDSLAWAAGFTGGVFALAGVLTLAARGAIALARRMPRTRLPPTLRHGVAALARPGAGTVGAVVALGLGVMVVVAMELVERRLADELRSALPRSAPSVFLVDVQPPQWPEVEALLEQHGATAVDSVPVVMARLAAIDGRPVDALVDEGGRRRWVLTREQRLTWRQDLPEDNVVVEGALWNDPARQEVSLEEGFARDLGAHVGTRLEFDVQGVPVELDVTSLRTVEWATFAINFFVVVEPGVLDDAPHFRIASARLPADAEQPVQDLLARRAPNVTLLRVRAILERLGAVFERLALGVRLLGGCTALAGVAILAGAVGATSLRRAREAALLKVLGVTRRGVAARFAVEYALVGLLAGTIGALGASALAWTFLVHVLELRPELPAAPAWIGALATAALGALSGLAGSVRALAAPPLATLRG